MTPVASFIVSATLHSRVLRNNRVCQSFATRQFSSPPTSSSLLSECQVVFVVGGPGSGKGTQCELLQERLPTSWKQLCAGELLRAEMNKPEDTELGSLIRARLDAGQIVPSHITVQLLENAMQQEYETNNTRHFMLDGFPRNLENVEAWEAANPDYPHPKFLLSFDCPESVLVQRLLERGQSSGRSDDQIDVIRKRFQTYQKESLPVVSYYEKLGVPVHCISSEGSVEDIYKQVEPLFDNLETSS